MKQRNILFFHVVGCLFHFTIFSADATIFNRLRNHVHQSLEARNTAREQQISVAREHLNLSRTAFMSYAERRLQIRQDPKAQQREDRLHRQMQAGDVSGANLAHEYRNASENYQRIARKRPSFGTRALGCLAFCLGKPSE